MYCRICGNELINNICPNCKVVTKEKYPKGLIYSAVMGAFSLAFAALSLYSLMLGYYCYLIKDDTFTILSIIFSICLFGITGIISGLIGFFKARIVRKGGIYVTCGYTLNLSGIVICCVEIALASIILILI